MRAGELGATSLQTFTKSPRTRNVSDYTDEDIATAVAAREKYDIHGGMIHASYLINLAKPYAEAQRERDAMLYDLRVADALGYEMVNVHVGKTAKKYTPAQARQNMYDNTASIIETAASE